MLKFLSFSRRSACAVLLLFLLSCTHPKPEEVVAQAGEIKIKVAELQKALRQEGANFPPEHWEDKGDSLESKKRILKEIIDRRLLLTEAHRQGLEVEEEEVQKEIRQLKNQYTEMSFQKMLHDVGMNAEDWLEKKRDNVLIRKYLNSQMTGVPEITEGDVEKYYEMHLEEFKVPESVHVRQIVTDSKEKAESIIRRLRNGENFAKLARDLSLSPDRRNGGDLGFIFKGSFPREFEVCFTMKPGEISPIIPSLYGFHIFKVLEKTPARTVELKELREKIILRIKQESRERRLVELMKGFYEKYPVQIQEKVLERVSL